MAEADESIRINVEAGVSGVGDINKLAEAFKVLDKSTDGAESVYDSLQRLNKLKITAGTQIKNLASGLKQLNTYAPNTKALDSAVSSVNKLSEELANASVKVGSQVNGLGSGLNKLNEYETNDDALKAVKKDVADLSDSLGTYSIKIGTQLNNLMSALKKVGGYEPLNSDSIIDIVNDVELLDDGLSQHTITIGTNINSLMNALGKVSGYKQASSDSLINIVNDVDALATGLSEKSVSVGTGIGRLMSSLEKLNGYSPVNSDSLINIVNDVDTLATGLSEKSIKIGSDIGRLVSALDKLNGYRIDTDGVSNAIAAVKALSQQLDGTSIDVTKDVTKIVNSLEKLSKLSVSSDTGKAAASAVNGIADNIDADQASGLSAALKKVAASSKETGSSARSAASGIDKMSKSEEDASTESKSLVERLGEFYNAAHKVASVYFVFSTLQSMFEGIANGLMTLVNNAADYQESMNLMTTSLGQYAQQAYNYAQQVQSALGIDASEFLENQGTLMTMARGFGVASDAAYTMSDNLTRLAYDWASFYNMDVSEAFSKMQSGMAGETEAVRELGYDLSTTRLQQVAYANGINESVSSMSQADKAYLRYIAIMEQVSWAQGDMAKTISSPANQMRVLSNQVSLAARALGNIFMPALSAIIPVAVAVVKVITTLANRVAEFFGGTGVYSIDFGSGGDLSDSTGDLGDAADDAADSLGDAGDAADDTGDSASDAADKVKELKRELMGFDEINKFSSQDDSSSSGSSPSGSSSSPSSGSGGSGGSGGNGISNIDLPTYSWDLNNMDDELYDKLMDLMDRLGDVWAEAAASVGKYLKQIGDQFAAIDWWQVLSDNIVAWNRVLANGVWAIAETIGPILVAFNVPATLAETINTVTSLLNALAQVIKDVGVYTSTFSKIALVPLAETIGNDVREALVNLQGWLKGVEEYLKDNEGLFEKYGAAAAKAVGPSLLTAWSSFKELVYACAGQVKAFFDECAKNGMLDALGQLVVNINGFLGALLEVLAKVVSGIADFIDKSGLGKTAADVLKTAVDALSKIFETFGNFLRDNGDAVAQAIVAIGAAIAAYKTYNAVSGVITNITDAFSASKDVLELVSGKAKDVGTALGIVADAYPNLGSAITDNKTLLTDFFSVLSEAPAKSGTLVSGLTTGWSQIKDGFSGAAQSVIASLESISPKAASVVASVATSFGTVKTSIAEGFSAAGSAVSSSLGTVTSAVSSWLSTFKLNMAAGAQMAVESFSNKFPQISSIASSAFSGITGAFSSVVSGLTSGASTILTTLTTCIPGGVIVAAIAAIVAAVAWWVTQTEDGQKAWSEFTEGASKTVENAKSTICAAFSRVVEALQPIISKLAEVATAIGKLALNILGNTISGIAGFVTGVATAVAKVAEFLAPIVNLLGSIALDMVATALQAINAALGGISGVIGTVTGGIGGFISNLFGVETAEAAVVDSTEDVADAADEASDSTSEYDQKIQDNIESIENYDDANGTLQRAMEQTGMSTQDLAKYLADTDQTVDEYVQSIEDYADSVINGFQKIDTESQTSLDDMVSNLESNITTTANWSANLKKMMAMTGLDSSNALVQEMISGGPEKYSKALDEIVSSEDNAAKFKQAAEDYGNSLVNTYGTTVSNGASTAESGGETLVNSTSQGMQNASAGASSTAQSVDQQTVQQFGSHYSEASDAGANLTGGFGDGVARADMVSLAVSKAQQVCQQVVSGLNGGSGYNQAKSAGANLMGGYADGLASAVSAAVSQASSALSQVIPALNGGSGYNQAKSAGANLMGGYKDGLQSAVNSAVSVAKSCMDSVNNALGSGNSSAYSKGSGTMNSFRSGLQSGVSSVTSLASSTAKQVQNGLGSNYNGAYSAGSNEMWGFQNGLNSVANNIYNVGRNAAVRAQNGLGSNYWGAYSAGNNLGWGFNNGLCDTASTIYDNARAIANNSVNIINSALRVGSPSKRTHETGEFFTQGFANGIADDAKKAYSNVADLADEAVACLDVATEASKVGESIGSSFSDALSLSLDTSSLSSAVSLSKAVNSQAATWAASNSRRPSVTSVTSVQTDDTEVAQTIASAVAQGMVSVQMGASSSKTGSQDTTIVLRVGNEDLARAVYKGQDSLARRGVISLG